MLIPYQSKYSQREPFVVGRCGGRRTCCGEFVGLLAELFRSPDGLTIDDDVAIDTGYVTAVVVGDRSGVDVISELTGDTAPRGRGPGCTGGPTRGRPGALVFAVPLLAVNAGMVNVISDARISCGHCRALRTGVLRLIAFNSGCTGGCTLRARVLGIVAVRSSSTRGCALGTSVMVVFGPRPARRFLARSAKS